MKYLDAKTFFSAVKDKTNIKTSSGSLLYLHAVNGDAAVRYIQIFNAAAADVTLGTTTPVMVLTLAASTYNSFNLNHLIPLLGTGICAAATTTPTGNTLSTADCYVNAVYN